MDTSAQRKYILGHSPVEHERLARQGAFLCAYTERLLRTAGIVPGMNILDLGCGVGDVSILAARLVGSNGSVVGIDQDLRALATARQRANHAELDNLCFEQAMIEDVSSDTLFDAVVGRFVLMFTPDPLTAVGIHLRNLCPGGLVVFQEPVWSVFFAHCADMPAHRECGEWICETLRNGGANPDMGLELYRILDSLGLDNSAMLMEVPAITGDEPGDWIVELMTTLQREASQQRHSTEIEFSLRGLPVRLAVEAGQSLRWHPMPALMGAWARKRQ